MSERKYKLLDLFCGAGGAAMGYYQAGFEVTGIDIKPQKHYPFTFIQADALEYVAAHGAEYDAIHASPPCQGYSSHVTSRSSRWNKTLGKDEPRLISETRSLLLGLGSPFVIENVYGARGDLVSELLLCGVMFDLPITRHRLFESNVYLWSKTHYDCRKVGKSYAALRGWDTRDMSVTGKGRRTGTTERWKEIMSIDWTISQAEIVNAIPPVYTQYIGAQLLAYLSRG